MYVYIYIYIHIYIYIYICIIMGGWKVMPRDEFGVPAHIPPELSTTIRHTYYVPPQCPSRHTFRSPRDALFERLSHV